MKKFRRSSEKALCLALSLIIIVMSYRSATAILSLAGWARNPTEGRMPAKGNEVDVRDNKPRPSKQRQLTRILRVKEEFSRSAPEPLQRDLPQMQERAVARFVRIGVMSDLEARTLEAEPQYLRLFLPAASGSPHSPPG